MKDKLDDLLLNYRLAVPNPYIRWGVPIGVLLIIVIPVFILLFSRDEAGPVKEHGTETTTEAPTTEVPTTEVPTTERPHSNSMTTMSVLLVGIDKTPEEKPESIVSTEDPSKKKNSVKTKVDSVSLVTYNPDDNSLMTLSLPNSLAVISGASTDPTFTAIYREMGMTAVKDAVQEYTGVPVVNTIVADREGFKNLVDAVGGVDVNSKIAINDKNNQKVGRAAKIDEGENHLDGSNTLAYTLFNNDGVSKQTARQNEVIQALVHEMMSGDLKEINKVFDTFKDDIDTDITFTSLAKRIPSMKEEPEYDSVRYAVEKVKDTKENYTQLKKGERDRVSKKMRTHIGISTATPLVPIEQN